MSSCCDPTGLTGMFDEKHARSKARRYRRDGLDAEARRIVEFLGERIAGRTVLEVGGGIGAIQLELLRRGASNAENVARTRAGADCTNSMIRSSNWYLVSPCSLSVPK